MGNYYIFGHGKLFIAIAMEANAFSPQMTEHILSKKYW